ncbi:hypothetical protein NL676_010513 [Syzygium grande]|nr:hypothetical protein NL676_010513 [Syzygium grande]
MIDDIGSHIESAHASTAQGKSHLVKAAKTQKSNSSMSCLLLVIFGVALLIVLNISPSSYQDENDVVDTKLVEEFGAVVREYRETERLEAEEEASHVPVAPQQANLPASRDSMNDEAGRSADQDADLHRSLDELKRMEALLLENENALKEILRDGEGNEEEVRRVQEEINSLKALINDLKSLEIEEVDATNIPRALTAQPQACDKKSNSTFLIKDQRSGHNTDQNSDPHDLLEQLKGMEALLLESESSLKEIIREGKEDEEEVRRIQEEIEEVRDSINDCKILIKDQVQGTDDIESALLFSTVRGTLHHEKAAGRRSNLLFLWNGSLSQFNLISDNVMVRIRSVKFQVTTVDEV